MSTVPAHPRTHYKRIVTAERDRQLPMSIDDIEEFCRTARREGAKGDTQVRTLGSAGTPYGMAVDIYIKPQDRPLSAAEQADRVNAGEWPDGNGRYIGLDKTADSGPPGTGPAASL